MTDTAGSFRVLMELRTCLEGFSGIPQETRLLFSAFQSLPNLKVDGMMNHPIFKTARALRHGRVYGPDDVHKRYGTLSRYIVTQKTHPHGIGHKLMPLRRRLGSAQLTISSWLGAKLPLDDFDGNEFRDFIWESLFSKSLAPADLEAVCAAGYRTLQHSWRDLHLARLQGFSLGFLGRYPQIDTRGYEVLLAQTPYPATVSPGTQLVVRYHDAIPLLLPQRISTMRLHRAMHYHALRANAPHAIFACTTHAVRDDLLRVFPKLEKRTPVVPDVVSHHYFPEKASRQVLSEIIRHRINTHSEPAALRSSSASITLYAKHLAPEKLRYILICCTLEPRKNHVRLIRAWESLRNTIGPDLKLVIVGDLGWEWDPIVEAMQPWQSRGQLFHLSRVPPGDLRRLYSGADCVVCPSVAEGFDLPGVEAQLCGTAVAASDIAVHREVYADGARYFDPYSVSGMADTIESILRADPVNETPALEEKALANAQQYRREAIAPRWAELFGRIGDGEFAALHRS